MSTKCISKLGSSGYVAAFADLQTEVTDFTSDLNVIGIPFWDYRTYTFKVLFPSHSDHPILHSSLKVTEHDPDYVYIFCYCFVNECSDNNFCRNWDPEPRISQLAESLTKSFSPCLSHPLSLPLPLSLPVFFSQFRQQCTSFKFEDRQGRKHVLQY